MARSKNRLQIQLEYAVVRGLFELLKKLPLTWAEWVSRHLLSFLIMLLSKRRRILRTNIAACFPEKSPTQHKLIAQESIETLAKGIARFPRLPELFQKDTREWLTLDGVNHVKDAFKKGRGVIVFTAHFGFWEGMTLCMQKYCGPMLPVARPLDNPKLEKLVSSIRQSNGARIIHQHSVLKQGLQCLRKNQILGFLIDQNFYKGGLFVNFFGRPAATTSIVSLLARRTGAAVLPLHSLWKGKKLHVVLDGPMPLSTHANPERAAAEDTQAMAGIMEGWIRKDPGQWLWLHNRWKRQPQEGDYVYSGKELGGDGARH